VADRPALGSLISSAALCAAVLGAAGLSAACGSTPVSESASDDSVPLPAVVLAPPVGAADSADGAGPDTADTPDAASSGASSVKPRWFPSAGAVVRLAGLSPADDSRLLEVRTVSAADGNALTMDVVIRASDGSDEDVARESYVVTVTDKDVRIALAPDAVRAVPKATRELPRDPRKGAKWRTPAGRCEVESVGEDVMTFTGTRSGCVRVRLTTRTGSHSTRWFDPDLGEIRREVRDRRGKLIAAWALCGAEPPAADRYAPVLLGAAE